MAPHHSHHSIRRLAGIAALLSVLAVAGCAAERATEVRPPKQATVQTVDHFHSVAFADGSAQLAAAERQRLLAFLQRVDAAAADDVVIAPWPPEPAGLAPSPHSTARSAAVAAVLRTAGFEPVVVSLPGQEALGTGPRVDVAVRRYLVVLPDCPDWSDHPGWSYNNQPSSNWGCATAVNLGMMVANPKDLLRGRGPAAATAEPLVGSIVRYRLDKIKQIEKEATSQAFQSSTGQQ